MQVEVPVRAEVLAWKVLAIGLGHQALELLVAQFVELFGADRLADPQAFGGCRFHGFRRRAVVHEYSQMPARRPSPRAASIAPAQPSRRNARRARRSTRPTRSEEHTSEL